MDKDKIDAFWNAVEPTKYTLDDFVHDAGKDITFRYQRRTYIVNTKPNYPYATRSIQSYYDWLERKVDATEPQP